MNKFLEMARSKNITYSNSERLTLGHVLAFYFGGKRICTTEPQTLAEFGMNISDIVANFDFTVADPTQNLDKFLLSRRERFNGWCDRGSCDNFSYNADTSGLSGAFALRKHLHGVLDIVSSIVFEEDPVFLKRTTNVLERASEIFDTAVFKSAIDGLIDVFPRNSTFISYGSFVNQR